MVAITWSLTNGGAAITDVIDHSTVNNGSASAPKQIFLRHDGVFSITGCGLYIRQYSATYNGDATAPLDFAEMLEWGDSATSEGFGGFEVNMDAIDTYPAEQWPTFLDKTTPYGYVCRTGVGDSAGTAVTLVTQTGCTALGEIQTGASPNVRFSCRFEVPSNEDTLGVRLIDQVLLYTYTS